MLRVQCAKVPPLHSSLGDRPRLHLKNKNKEKEISIVLCVFIYCRLSLLSSNLYVYHNLLIHSTVNEYSSNFHFGDINSTVINILLHVCRCSYVCVPIAYTPGSEIARSQVCVYYV